MWRCLGYDRQPTTTDVDAQELNLFFKDLKQQNQISVWRCLLGSDCQPTTEVSRCRSFSNATLFRKIIAVAVELSRDLMCLALLGVQPEGGGGTPYNGLYGEGSAKKGYLFESSCMWKGMDFTSWSLWKCLGNLSLRIVQGLTGAVHGCKKSKPMVLLQNIKVMQRYKVVCERGTIFQWQEYERGIFYARNGI